MKAIQASLAWPFPICRHGQKLKGEISHMMKNGEYKGISRQNSLQSLVHNEAWRVSPVFDRLAISSFE